MKRIAVKVAGNTAGPRDVMLNPGTTAAEILRELNLEGYLLSLPNSDRFFAATELDFCPSARRKVGR
jgi:hypothetical protein